MHVGGWFVAAWWHIGLLNDWHLWGYLPHLYHHYTAVCYADYVDSHKVVCWGDTALNSVCTQSPSVCTIILD